MRQIRLLTLDPRIIVNIWREKVTIGTQKDQSL